MLPSFVPLSSTPVAAQYLATFLKPEMLHIYRQITALREFQPVVLCQKRENPEKFPFEHIQVLPKPPTHQIRRFFQKQLLGRPVTIYRSEARRILFALHEIRAQVLHVYFGHIGVHLLPLLEICPLPVVVSFHGADAQVNMDKPVYREFTRRMFEKATLLLVRSQSLGKRLEALGASTSRIRLHRTGIPLTQIAFTKRDAPPDGAWRCVQACRLIAKKGLHTSIRAFAEFAQQYPKARFVIAGDGPLEGELKALSDSLGLSDRIEFAGFLPEEKLRALYADSHLFLHPSQMGEDGDQEGVPNSMLEAMASGLPPAATLHGGIPEAVEHGVSGLLTPEGEASALAGSLFTFASNPSRYAGMSAAAAAQAAAKFDLRAQTHVLEECYREAISAKSGQP